MTSRRSLSQNPHRYLSHRRADAHAEGFQHLWLVAEGHARNGPEVHYPLAQSGLRLLLFLGAVLGGSLFVGPLLFQLQQFVSGLAGLLHVFGTDAVDIEGYLLLLYLLVEVRGLPYALPATCRQHVDPGESATAPAGRGGPPAPQLRAVATAPARPGGWR